jgi:hypothetical protein
MILTLLWRWLRDLWRGDPEAAAIEAPPLMGSSSPIFTNASSDADKAGVVVFEGDQPEEPAAPR